MSKKPIRNFRPESLMMTYGYKPELSEGSLKCPIFQSSTFVFENAEAGKAFFEVAYGLREQEQGEEPGLIYSRLNNPDLEILERRLCLWDQAEDCAIFESGMAAIATTFLEFLQPGDLLLYSNPIYGGTAHFIQHFLKKLGIHCIAFDETHSQEELIRLIEDSGMAAKLGMIYVETPANPTNTLIDLKMCSQVARYFSRAEKEVLLVVDNTYMGPIWQQPLALGADLVLYSATKYIGGHSDVIAGACLGNSDLMKRVKTLRTFMGNMAAPWTSWLLMRSLETLKLRMDKQAENAQKIARYLAQHSQVEAVHYLGLLSPEDGLEYTIYQEQCLGPGAMISFEVPGGETAAFRFINQLKLVKLAVSLGGTETLVQHPATMTHAAIPESEKQRYGIKSNLIRLSVGVEHTDDLITDLEQALAVLVPAKAEAVPVS